MHVDKTVENVRACMCLSCPSYTTTCKLKNGKDIPYDVSHLEHLELMFCAFEKAIAFMRIVGVYAKNVLSIKICIE